MNGTLGKYQLIRVLGKGAMGTVYEGFDPAIDRRVAIKTVKIQGADDPEAQDEIARFKREAQAAGRLHHPFITSVFDYGETPEIAYIVMEFVEGSTLRQVLDSGRRFTLPEILGLMEDLLTALQYSHERGVVHRDIKPANIMLDKNGGIKIADFGIARLESSSSMTQAGTMMGTPSYMSPEQFLAQTVDSRTDLYSAGVVLYQLLTGEKPFDGSLTSLMHKVLYSEPPPPSAISVSSPKNFDPVVARALAKRPDERFSTAAEFATALRAAFENRPKNAPDVAVAMFDPNATQVRRAASGIDATMLSIPVVSSAWAKLQPKSVVKDLQTEQTIIRLKEEKQAKRSHWGRNLAFTLAFLLLAGETAWILHPRPAVIVPAPPPAAVPAAPPMTMAQRDEKLAGVLSSLPCTLFTGADNGTQARISGYTGDGAPEGGFTNALGALPANITPAVSVATVEGPYCTVLDTIRPYKPLFAAAGTMLTLALTGGKTQLANGDLITVDNKLPAFAGYLQTDYFSGDGTVFHLYPTPVDPLHQSPGGGLKTLGDPTHGGASWAVSAPFGPDMIVSIYSSAPLFTTPRPQDEETTDYLSALRQALQTAADAGNTVSVAALPVVTVPHN
jgi:serine/threonine-protein kinase